MSNPHSRFNQRCKSRSQLEGCLPSQPNDMKARSAFGGTSQSHTLHGMVPRPEQILEESSKQIVHSLTFIENIFFKDPLQCHPVKTMFQESVLDF